VVLRGGWKARITRMPRKPLSILSNPPTLTLPHKWGGDQMLHSGWNLSRIQQYRAFLGVGVADPFARHLRKNLTDAERRLWFHLRHEQLDGSRFRRQAPIGCYIVDFVSFDRNLIVELDGGQHAVQIESDAARTAWLNSQGFRVLRFWNNQVFEELESVLETIWLAVRSAPHPQGGDQK
jgi:very-short-patch-repair endonuclease